MIDTTRPSGEPSFHIFSALAQFERRLIQKRTKAGLASVRARGRKGCRPRLAETEPRIPLAKKLQADGSVTLDAICKTLHVSRTTYYRYDGAGRKAGRGRPPPPVHRRREPARPASRPPLLTLDRLPASLAPR